MALNFRQQLFYKYTVDIWRLQEQPPTDTTFDTDVPVLTDYSGSYQRIAQDVRCMFWSTPENDEPTAIGRTKAVNIFTMDRWKFPAEVDVADTDLLVCTAGPTGFQQAGWIWAVQGNTQGHNTLLVSNTQMVYGKLIDNAPQALVGTYPELGI